MKHVLAAIFRVIMVMLTAVSATNTFGQQEAAGAGCSDIQSTECRAKAASLVQDAFSEKFPNLRVRASGDIIVFAEPQAFEKQEDRASFYRGVIKNEAMQTLLCRFGFKKARLESSAGASTAVPKEAFDLRCPTTEQSKPEVAKSGGPTSPIESTPQAAQKESQGQGSDGEISGRIFLITKGGDLKPARLAQVVLLYGGVLGGSHDNETASIIFYKKKVENMKASYQSLARPGDASCRAALLVFNSSLKSTLEWGQTTGKAKDQIRIIDSDEEGLFHFPQVPIGEYTVVAWGHAGANSGYWEESLKGEPGQTVVAKLASPHTACLD